MAQLGGIPIVVQQPFFGDSPVQATCGRCGATVITTVSRENGGFSYLMAFIVCLVFCPCFWVPLVIDSCKDVYHSCPSCGAQLGVKKSI